MFTTVLQRPTLSVWGRLQGLLVNHQRSIRHWSALPLPQQDATESQLSNLPSDLPCPRDYEVKQAIFVKSSSDMTHLPTQVGAEFAFIGHSNVGKSSLINLLTGNPQLAKVSKKPGKTKTVNHFLVNRKWYLVDCPGYGDALVSKQQQLEWHEFTKAYFLGRKTLAHTFLLVDASRPPIKLDVDCALWLHEANRPFTIVFTKLDCSHPELPTPEHNMATFTNAMSTLIGIDVPYVSTSSSTGLGREALLKYISSLRQTHRMPLIFK